METICITMPQEEKDKLMQILEENNMTIDQAANGFLRWQELKNIWIKYLNDINLCLQSTVICDKM